MVSIEELDDNEETTYYPTMNHLLVLKEMNHNWCKVYTSMKTISDFDIDINPIMERITKIYFLTAKEEPESVKYDTDSDSDIDSDWSDDN
jgi:hypothetical protein